MDFLANSNVTTLEHPPYSTDQAPADFHPFPRLKSAMKGRRWCGTDDIIKNATEELKRLSQHGFQGCFNNFTDDGKSAYFRKEIILKEMWLK